MNTCAIQEMGKENIMVISAAFVRGRCIELAVRYYIVKEERDVKENIKVLTEEIKSSSGHSNISIIGMTVYFIPRDAIESIK